MAVEIGFSCVLTIYESGEGGGGLICLFERGACLTLWVIIKGGWCFL